MLETAVFLLILIGILHSYLGEKYILIRLFKRGNIPPLFGSDHFTKNTLRFAWHLTTVAWFGFAALLVLLIEDPDLSVPKILNLIGVVFLIHSIITLAASKGKHFAWPVFLSIAGLCFYGAIGVS